MSNRPLPTTSGESADRDRLKTSMGTSGKGKFAADPRVTSSGREPTFIFKGLRARSDFVFQPSTLIESFRVCDRVSAVAASDATETQKQLTPQEIHRIEGLLMNRHRGFMPRTVH